MPIPFNVDHVKKFCSDIVLPPKTDPDSLSWGFRFNKIDLRSSHDYRWPFPGHWAKATGPTVASNNDPCCSAPGDGICAALTLEGAQSAGNSISASAGLLVAWSARDVLASSADKVRLRRAWVAALFAPLNAVVSDADLRYADLSYADLSYADLRDANLRSARVNDYTSFTPGFKPVGVLEGGD